ncbi:hypothetical protein GIB67_042032, partial [Kingdonia uniflora]
VVQVRSDISEIGFDIELIQKMIFGLEGKLELLENKQDITNSGIWHLCQFAGSIKDGFSSNLLQDSNTKHIENSSANHFENNSLKGLQFLAETIESGEGGKLKMNTVLQNEPFDTAKTKIGLTAKTIIHKSWSRPRPVGMDGVQLYTIVHFRGDIIRPKIGSIVSYVGGSTKLISLRAHSSYKDFVTLLEETNKIRREDWLSTTKDTGSGKELFTTKAGGYFETNDRGLDLRRFRPLVEDDDVPQSNDFFETIRTNVPPSNEPSIPQSNVHHSNEPMLTNVPQSNEFFQTIPTDVLLSNEPILTNILLSIKPEPIIGHIKPSEDLYDFSKKFSIGDLYRDRIELKNHIRAYAAVNKFDLEHVLSNEYKIVMRGSFEHAYQLFTSYFAEVRYEVAYTNHVESWNNVILKVRNLPIHVFIEELRKICSKMSYTYWEEVEMSQSHLTAWATDYCESRKFVVDLLTYKVRTSRHHFQMTSYGRTDSLNIEDGTCSCR